MNRIVSIIVNKIDLKWRHRLAYAVIYVCIGLLMVVMNQYTDQLKFLDTSNTLFISPTEFDNDFSAHHLRVGDDREFDFSVTLPKSSFDLLEDDEYKLIINGVHDNAIKVWFNDQLVISEGDMRQGFSMLKADHVYGSIESTKVESVNVLRIQTYATYKSGSDKQLIISEKETGERALKYLNLFGHWSLLLGVGFIAMSLIFVLIIYLFNRKGNMILLLLSIATFFISFYFLDFLKVTYLTFSYFAFKKILLLCLSLGVLFYGFAIYSDIKKKYIVIMPLFQLLYYCVIMGLSPDIVEFKGYYNYWYMGLGLTIGIFLLSSLINLRKSRRTFIIFIHFLTLSIFGFISLRVEGSNGYFSLVSPVMSMITIAVLPMIITFDLLLEKDLRVQREKDLKNVAYNQSMTDDLTGAWNKRYLEHRLYNLPNNTVVAMIDLDNLKSVNDSFGHLAGDAVLCDVTDKIRTNIRKNDDICRYGGDEFVVIFEGCNMEYAIHIMEKVRKLIEHNTIVIDDTIITTSISVGLCTVTDECMGDEVIQCADQQLYLAKAKGKNRTEYV